VGIRIGGQLVGKGVVEVEVCHRGGGWGVGSYIRANTGRDNPLSLTALEAVCGSELANEGSWQRAVVRQLTPTVR
jgi:hypothetical protein